MVENSALSFRLVVYVNGVSESRGTIVEPITKIEYPDQDSLRVILAREASGAPYGRLQQANGDWSALASTTPGKLDWTKITGTSAVFKFRVAYKSLTDWAIYTIREHLDYSGIRDGWQVDVRITDYYGKNTWLVRPTAYLPAVAVRLTP